VVRAVVVDEGGGGLDDVEESRGRERFRTRPRYQATHEKSTGAAIVDERECRWREEVEMRIDLSLAAAGSSEDRCCVVVGRIYLDLARVARHARELAFERVATRRGSWRCLWRDSTNDDDEAHVLERWDGWRRQSEERALHPPAPRRFWDRHHAGLAAREARGRS
jgi:hypothetical protein